MTATGRILDGIASPADLKGLSEGQLNVLAQEIRDQIIATTSKNGGHVASSLGAVEIILAVHSKIDSPKDRFVFDVGHQAYAHKLITGRLADFDTLRQFEGISGFPKPQENPHDVHPSGHASDSLSIALGLAKARDLRGTDEKIVTLIGDASIGGGMAFEALSHIGAEQTPMLIILNDNEMSIGHSVGALTKHFGALRTTDAYRKTRDDLQERMEHSGPITRALLNFGRSAKDSVKQFFIHPHTMVFEQLGIVCTAPVDGHDIHALREMLDVCLGMKGPVLMHVVTKKGTGYQPAIDDPERFHGLGPYDLATGAAPAKDPAAAPTYTEVFGKALVEEARANDKVVAMTAAMGSGTGLKAFAKEFPQRYVDGGIAEEHVVGMGAGLAFAGMRPVVAIYSTFLQRAVDQIIIDGALSDLNMVFAIDRAGVVGEDGPTHHGVFDIAYMRMVPHMKMLAPSDEAELALALHTALALDGPVALRYPRGAAEGACVPAFAQREVLTPGKAKVALGEPQNAQVSILAWGRMVGSAKAAAQLLAQAGITACIWDMRWVKPLDEEAIRLAAASRLVVTVEEGTTIGGVGEGVLEVLAAADLHPAVLTLGIPDEFVAQGKPARLLQLLGLDGEGIAAAVKAKLGC